MSIKAIETRYKGYRFRSRLEARWAVFFENAGIEWLYEPQGFVTPYGPYLPDFHLPKAGAGTGGVWVEVKPKRFEDIELAKLEYVVANNPDSLGAALVGDPVDMYAESLDLDRSLLQADAFCLYGWNTVDGSGDQQFGFDGPATFYSCSRCDHNGIAYYKNGPVRCDKLRGGNCDFRGCNSMVLVTNAALTARSARFEHGEVPA